MELVVLQLRRYKPRGMVQFILLDSNWENDLGGVAALVRSNHRVWRIITGVGETAHLNIYGDSIAEASVDAVVADILATNFTEPRWECVVAEKIDVDAQDLVEIRMGRYPDSLLTLLEDKIPGWS